MKYIAVALVMGLCALAASVGNGLVISKTIEGMTRQPELKKDLQMNMFISVGLIEAVPLLGVIAGFLLLFVID